MATIKPFKAFRPLPEYASHVASKPYDVLNSKEAREEASGNPYSFLRVVKSEITLPEETYQYAPEVYKQARENFYHMVDEGVIEQDPVPSMYIYRQVMPTGRKDNSVWEQTGVVALSSVNDYFNDVIKKHEHTRPEKEQDRINHMKATGLHSGPVFLTYPDVAEINDIVADVVKLTPQYDFKADDGVRHVLWVVDEPEKVTALSQLFRDRVPFTYIADGHHRAASSAKVGREMAESNPNHTGNESYNYFLSVLFPAGELNIIDYNRVVKDLHGLSEPVFMDMLESNFEVERHDGPYRPTGMHRFGMYLNGQWYRLTAKEGVFPANDPVESLDVAILQKFVLDQILGIKDPRTDERVDFVGGIRGLEYLQKLVNSGDFAVAFSLFPVNIQQLIRISDAGMVMPPKSTWFEPKLRSGLVVHKFEEE